MPKSNFVTAHDDDEEEVIEAKPKEEKKPEPRKFKQDDLILCRSVTVGGLGLTGSKSQEYYRWDAYGDETEVEYGDLLSLIRGKSSYIFGPMFIIEDNEMVDQFPELKKFYEDSYTVKDLEGVLALDPDSMVRTLETLPKRALTTIKSIASTQIADGRLDSVQKIKALDNFFGTELNLLASLFE